MPVTRSESGINLDNWIVNVGDGNYVAPGEAPITLADITTVNKTNKSVLEANIQNRRIMTHNITFHRIIDPTGLTDVHTATYKFKVPYVISTSNTDFNGQTVEGGLFVWDGANTQLDYGLAFQWVTNPWDPNYKALLYWDGEGWQSLGANLEPDTSYHTIDFFLDIPNAEAYITLDGILFTTNVYSETTKTGWGNTVDARFQAETISIFPPETGSIPKQKVNFKDWTWEWSNDNPV